MSERTISVYDDDEDNTCPVWFGSESDFDRDQLSAEEWQTLETDGRVTVGGGAAAVFVVTMEGER